MIDTKYSIILMRDDAKVRRCRMSQGTLRCLIYTLVFILIAAAGGLFGGYHFWRGSLTVRGEKLDLEKKLMEAEVRLERLQNLDRILRSNDPSEVQTAIDATVLQAITASPAPASPASPASRDAAPAPSVNLNEILAPLDLKQVRIENVQARYGDDKFKVSFDLNNLLQTSTLAGQVEISLVASDATTHRLNLAESEAAFQIQRFKRVVTSPAAPKAFDKTRFYGLKLVIKSPTGSVIFSETYPLSSILS